MPSPSSHPGQSSGGGPKPPRLNRLLAAEMGDHTFVQPADVIFYLGEYRSGGGYAASEMNSHIANIKRRPSECSARQPLQFYKNKSLEAIARALTEAISLSFLADVSFVPIPPSTAKGDPEYDDRLIRILDMLHGGNGAKHVCELLSQNLTIRASHASQGRRPSVDELLEVLVLDSSLAGSLRQTVVLFDDILTTGRHFRAAQTKVIEARPDAEVIGLFIAKVSRSSPE